MHWGIFIFAILVLIGSGASIWRAYTADTEGVAIAFGALALVVGLFGLAALSIAFIPNKKYDIV